MLTWTSESEPVAITVRFGRWDVIAQRATYHYTIAVDGSEIVDAEDLNVPSDRAALVEPLRSLQSFLSAWVESRERGDGNGENADLFPTALWDAHPDWEAVVNELWSDVCVDD